MSHFDEQRETILKEYFELLRFPTVGAEPTRLKDCVDCAMWLKKWLTPQGFAVELFRTFRLPCRECLCGQGGTRRIDTGHGERKHRQKKPVGTGIIPHARAAEHCGQGNAVHRPQNFCRRRRTDQPQRTAQHRLSFQTALLLMPQDGAVFVFFQILLQNMLQKKKLCVIICLYCLALRSQRGYLPAVNIYNERICSYGDYQTQRVPAQSTRA